MSDEEFKGVYQGAYLTAAITFFATWVAAIVMFNFIGFVLGWIPALIVAVVLYFTAPILYTLLGCLIFIVFPVAFLLVFIAYYFFK